MIHCENCHRIWDGYAQCTCWIDNNDYESDSTEELNTDSKDSKDSTDSKDSKEKKLNNT
jgi:hypothetical protein